MVACAPIGVGAVWLRSTWTGRVCSPGSRWPSRASCTPTPPAAPAPTEWPTSTMRSESIPGWRRSHPSAVRRSSAKVGMVATPTSPLRPWPRASSRSTRRPASSRGCESGTMSAALAPHPWMTSATGPGRLFSRAATGSRNQPRRMTPGSVTIRTSTASAGTCAASSTRRTGRPKRRLRAARIALAKTHRTPMPPATPAAALSGTVVGIDPASVPTSSRIPPAPTLSMDAQPASLPNRQRRGILVV